MVLYLYSILTMKKLKEATKQMAPRCLETAYSEQPLTVQVNSQNKHQGQSTATALLI